MKAIVYTKYGSPDVLQLKEVEKPAPMDNEVLVKIHATTVTIGDTIMRSLNLPVHGWQKVMGRMILGWNKPRRSTLGMELTGEIEAIGRKVDFLIQEMNREVNTIGSKANDSLISREVVTLKAELEKFREQAQNVE